MIKHKIRNGNILGPVPNWAKDFNFELQYKTVISKYRDGTEERESIIDDPRIRIEFTSHFMTEDAHEYIAEFSDDGWNNPRFMELPFRRLDVTVSDEAPGVLTATTLPFWVQPGVAVILDSGVSRELAVIQLVMGLSVILDGPGLTSAYGPLRMYQAVPVEFDGDLELKPLTNMLFEARMRLVSRVGEYLFPRMVISETSFENNPIFYRKPNWRTVPSITLNPELRVSDFGFGRRFQKRVDEHLARSIKQTFTFLGVDDFEWLLSFIHARRARRGAFWYPDWTNPPQYQGTNLSVSNNLPLSPSLPQPDTFAGRAMILRYANGTLATRRLASAGDGSLLTFTSNLPTALSAANFWQLNFMQLCRIASDDIQFQFKSSSYGNAEIPMLVLSEDEL